MVSTKVEAAVVCFSALGLSLVGLVQFACQNELARRSEKLERAGDLLVRVAVLFCQKQIDRTVLGQLDAGFGVVVVRRLAAGFRYLLGGASI